MRFIADEALGRQRLRVPCAPACDGKGAPDDLLKLSIYGYLDRVRSSRRLDAECHRDMSWVQSPAGGSNPGLRGIERSEKLRLRNEQPLRPHQALAEVAQKVVETPRNGPVRNLYRNGGFRQDSNGIWIEAGAETSVAA